MSYTFPVSLGKVEEITERPFTHIDHISNDRDILVHMAKQLHALLEKHPEIIEMSKSIYIDEPDGHSHRYFVPWPSKLSQTNKIHFVGFFSHKQEGAVSGHFGDLDERLIEQIPTYKGILSYSTMGLPGGDFGNLVLITDEEIKSRWLHGETHNKAVSLSPDYYQFIRINNGILPNGITDPQSLRITRVKYYDYGEDPPWKAVRELSRG